jgi:signal transduction histidine kinase
VRRRLLTSTLAAAGVALVLLGLPLAVAVRTLLTNQALDGLRREAEQAQLLLEERASTREEARILLTLLAQRSGSRYTLVDGDGGVIVDTEGAPPGTVALPVDVRAALATGLGRAVGDDLVAVAIRVPNSDVVVRTATSGSALRGQVRRAWLAILGLAVTALAAAALLARRQTAALAGPLEDLAGSARRLGSGDFSARAPRSGVPELDDVAEALDSTAGRLGTTLERSRSFSADASHQLRTPLTALRLHLEALEATAADPDLAAAAITEADRLEATIDELAVLAEPAASEELVDLAGLAAERLDAWRALARAQGRQVVLDAAPVPLIHARPAALGQSLQVLLDNALEHGAGTIRVTVHPVAGGARLCVADEGPGIPSGAEASLLNGRAAGRGLPLARSLVEAEGGRLRLERARPHAMLCLVLPAAEADC